ncbi:MAG: Maf family protein [Fibromonadaceae bacterium]|jgi:septum formation protein|nr:Maf family protein [Fibromonadaceae bacterium]
MIILASASPRRAQILSQLGFVFRIEPPACEEEIKNVSIEKIPKELAKRKALEVSIKFPEDFALGGDTLVFCDSLTFGKPKDGKEAFDMLKTLKNRSHKVVSGLALCKNGQILFSGDACTEVFFRNYTDSEILDYISTMEYSDKAGAYGAQGKGARFIESINGCFYNVMGLPVALAIEALNNLG